MRCKDIRHVFIEDAGKRGLSPKEHEELDEHLATCERCSSFREGLESVRRGVEGLAQPAPSDRTDYEVRTLLRNAASERGESAAPLPSRWGSLSIPRYIWASIPVLLVLTTLIMAWGLQDVIEKTSSFLAASFVALLLQNAAMLVFAPILIRALRRKESQSTWKNGDAHVS